MKFQNDYPENFKPVLYPDEYIFVTINKEDFPESLKLNPVSFFIEKEGISLIIERKIADENNISYSSVFKMITLSVYSDLNSVGLIAEVSSRLVEADISVNPVAAYHHDHLFVPSSKAEEAVKIIKNINVY